VLYLYWPPTPPPPHVDIWISLTLTKRHVVKPWYEHVSTSHITCLLLSVEGTLHVSYHHTARATGSEKLQRATSHLLQHTFLFSHQMLYHYIRSHVVRNITNIYGRRVHHKHYCIQPDYLRSRWPELQTPEAKERVCVTLARTQEITALADFNGHVINSFSTWNVLTLRTTFNIWKKVIRLRSLLSLFLYTKFVTLLHALMKRRQWPISTVTWSIASILDT
jgi:hypothetical protein